MYTSRLREKYKKEIVPKLQKEHGYKNNMAVPKIVKVVVNAGLGKILKNNADDLERISEDFAKITGQKGVITKARMAISGFKIRQGMSVGIKTTLRGNNMYDFLDKLINVSLPQIRDFRGFSKKSFDGKGNLSIGIREHIVFPEAQKDNIRSIFGLEIVIVTNAKTDEEASNLLKSIGFPLFENN